MAHIRAKRGTVSALTADADEFGTRRAPFSDARGQPAVAGEEIREGSAETGVERCARRDHGFQGRSAPARTVRLVTSGFLMTGGEPSTVTIRVQFSDRSVDRATKRSPHFNSESRNIARFFCRLSRQMQSSSIIDRMQSTCFTLQFIHSQLSAPPVWYSITRVSKKFRSFFRSVISLIHGNGLSVASNSGSTPICWQRRLAM